MTRAMISQVKRDAPRRAVNQPYTQDVQGCARCGGNHPGLEFKLFSRNPIILQGTYYERWAICPKTKEPIIMQVTVENP